MQETLGKYRLLGELGRGGMGIVWMAEATGPGGFEKHVVVKELRPDLAADPLYREMFLEEARLAARLRHKNIVQTNEVGCDAGRWFMVLELLEGCSLHEAIALLGDALPLGARVRIVLDVLLALHHAHELRDGDGKALGVVHRDVSPRNVFLTLDGQVKLLDFGVAKCRGRAHETKHGVLKGNVAYMSPDHVLGATIDRRADVFAAGVMLRELVSGERLWGDLSDVQVLRRLMSRDVPALPRHTVPEGLAAICDKAMAPNRADRFGTAEEMREALELWLAEAAPRGTLHECGERLARALGSRAPTEISSSALVTDVSTARAPERATWKKSLAMAAMGMMGIVMSVGATFALAHDALVLRTSEGVVTEVPPSPALAQLPIAAPSPVPEVTPAPEPVMTSAAEADAAVSVPELPPNPYEPHEI